MPALRTPDECFRDLPGYAFAPRHVEVPGLPGEPPLRMHYIDEGRVDAAPVLMLHGEPSWSYLYRQHDPARGGGGAPRGGARPDRLRPLRQAGAHSRTTPTSATSTG